MNWLDSLDDLVAIHAFREEKNLKALETEEIRQNLGLYTNQANWLSSLCSNEESSSQIEQDIWDRIMGQNIDLLEVIRKIYCTELRNWYWMSSILSEEKNCLVACGSDHLEGPNSLPSLLAFEGYKIEKLSPPNLEECENFSLLIACLNNDLNSCEEWIKSGANINQKYIKDGNTLALEAFLNEKFDILSCLLDEGALDLPNNKRQTLLECFYENGNYEAINHLVTHDNICKKTFTDNILKNKELMDHLYKLACSHDKTELKEILLEVAKTPLHSSENIHMKR